MTAQFLLSLSIWAATLSWATFLVWYSLRAKWWKHPVGWNTFGVSAVLFLILLRLSIIRISPDGSGDSVMFGIVVYSLAAVFGVQRVVFMEKAQRENRTKHVL